MNKAAILATLVLAVVVTAGCKDKKTQSSIFTYEISTSDQHLAKLEVVVGGKHASNTFQPVAAEYQALVTLPLETPSVLSSLAVELATPCGTKTIALKARESEAEETEGRNSQYRTVYLHVTATAPIPPLKEVWIDAPGAVTIGSMTLKKGKNTVYDLECKPDLEIKSGQTLLGTVPKAGDDTKMSALFVTAESKCYGWNGVKYGDERGGWRDVLRGKHIYPLPSSIDYFLEAAPSTITTSASNPDSTYRTELVPIACP